LKETILNLTAAPETLTPVEAADTLYRLLGKLPPADRLVLTLFYFEQCDLNEISARAGWNRELVKVRLHRARTKLKSLFEEAGMGGGKEMADLLKILDDLSARARREDPPSMDVSSRVLLRLSREARAPAWPMALVASGTAVAAIVVLSISLPLFEMLTDPWSVFFVMAANVLP
jgi:hypothetical protein